MDELVARDFPVMIVGARCDTCGEKAGEGLNWRDPQTGDQYDEQPKSFPFTALASDVRLAGCSNCDGSVLFELEPMVPSAGEDG